MTLLEAMHKTEPGRHAEWISELLYEFAFVLKELSAQHEHVKVAHGIPERLREIRGYLEKQALVELKPLVEKNEDYAWLRAFWERTEKAEAKP